MKAKDGARALIPAKESFPYNTPQSRNEKKGSEKMEWKAGRSQARVFLYGGGSGPGRPVAFGHRNSSKLTRQTKRTEVQG